MKSAGEHGVNADKKRGISSKKRKNRRKKKERKKNKKKVVPGHRFGKIVVHALARSLLAARARAHARSHGNSEISRSAFLLPSRSVFLLRLFHIPSRSHLIHPPTRCNDGEREERDRRREKGRDSVRHRADGTHRRNVLLGRERAKEKERREEAVRDQGETEIVDVHKVPLRSDRLVRIPF